MTIFYVIALALAVAGIVLAIVRVERGPSIFDRVLALDVSVVAALGIVAIVAAATGRTDLVPVMISLALVGFIGAVSIARFAVMESADEARILTKEELAQMQQEQPEDDDAPPVHDIDDDGGDDGGTVITVVDGAQDEEGAR